MLPGPSVTGPDVTPVALMAEEDEGGEETPPWRRGEASHREIVRGRGLLLVHWMCLECKDSPERKEEFLLECQECCLLLDHKKKKPQQKRGLHRLWLLF